MTKPKTVLEFFWKHAQLMTNWKLDGSGLLVKLRSGTTIKVGRMRGSGYVNQVESFDSGNSWDLDGTHFTGNSDLKIIDIPGELDNAPIAQQSERPADNREAVGATPTGGTIEAVLAEREKAYGPFYSQAETSQRLKAIVDARSRVILSYGALEALDQILHKIARIVNGGEHRDGWVDIIGYATLALEEFDRSKKETLG